MRGETPLEEARGRRREAETNRNDAKSVLAEAEKELTEALYAEIEELSKLKVRSHRKKGATE